MSPVPQYRIMKGKKGLCTQVGERIILSQDGSEKEEQKGEGEGSIEDS